MKIIYLIISIFLTSLLFGQQQKCPDVNLNNSKSAWDLAYYTFKKNDKANNPTTEDVNLYLCLMKQLDKVGVKKATSFLAQGYLYGLKINGGENIEQAEIYFNKLYYDTNYEDILISKKNLNTSIWNLLSKTNKKKMIEIFENRANKFNDEYSLKYLGDLKRYEKGNEISCVSYYKKSCELGNQESCNLINEYNKNKESFFTIYYAPPPPPPSRSTSVLPLNKKIDPNEIYLQVDVSAEYPGGLSELRKNFTKEKIKDDFNGIKRVELNFTIDAFGKVQDLKGFGKDTNFNNEIIKIFKSNKTVWKPAQINNQNVKSLYRLPITINFE